MSGSDTFFHKLVDPKGRSGRIDYLLAWLILVVAVVILEILHLAYLIGVLVFILVGIYPVIVAHIRRWHDLGRSGWLAFLSLIPLVNSVVFLYLLFAPGIKLGASEKQA